MWYPLMETVLKRGVNFVPNSKVRHDTRADRFDGFEQNYSLNELEWNRGASQQSTKELREAYLEFEAFQSQLWMRVGKQTIVWGKTELFRNQDQWNPVDIAIGPLASLRRDADTRERKIESPLLQVVHECRPTGADENHRDVP